MAGKRQLQTVLASLALLLLGVATAARAQLPRYWVPRGIGGGGALYAPSFNPLNPREMYVGSDMADTFHSADGGAHWEMLHFYQFAGNSTLCPLVICAADSLIRYGLSAGFPKKSTDGGQTWADLPGASALGSRFYTLYADPFKPTRVLLSDSNSLYSSSNGGNSFSAVYAGNTLFVAGAHFSGSRIFVGTSLGLMVSTNGGTSFDVPAIGGIPAGEGMCSFAGATQGATTRLWCVTMRRADIVPGMSADKNAWTGVYGLDYGNASSWTLRTTGINTAGGDFPFFVACATNDISRAYLAGGNGDMRVYRTANGGATWQSCFLTDNNANIFTGWSGWSSPYFFGWGFGGNALGFSVCPANADFAAVTDYGYIHVTTNAGVTWTQAYADPIDSNPLNSPSNKDKPYHGAGLNETAAWWLDWMDSNTLFASFTDIRGMVSTNRGASWRIPRSLSQNTTYESIVSPSNGFVYAAASSVHDLYSWDQYCRDARITGGTGGVIFSTNKAASWAWLHDFGKPVVSIALDPRFQSRMYAAVVNSNAAIGGIYVTSNLNLGAASTWNKLSNPPRTAGHPYKIRVLNDGTLVAAYSAQIIDSPHDFTASSGVFVSTNGGAAWEDRTAAGMRYYTKQITISPFDPGQSHWLAGVWGEWGNTRDLGGLYETTNRGVTWQRILGEDNSDPWKAVESCTFNPLKSNELWVTTETYGLMICTNFGSPSRTFAAVTNFPFSFTMGVFFNPYDRNEIWIVTHGGGMWVGRQNELWPAITNISFSIEGPASRVKCASRGLSGQQIVAQASSNLVAWQNIETNWMLDDGPFAWTDSSVSGVDRRYYRNRLGPVAPN